MHFYAVFNRDGGTFRTMDMAAFCARAEAIFTNNGHTISCHAVAREEVANVLGEGARRADVDVLMAGGGDGTISSAAAIAYANDLPLAVVPAGTMNLFARALGLPPEPIGALTGLATGQVRRIDIASANGRTFVHQFSVGVHPRLVKIRDTLSYRSRMGKLLASVQAFSRAVVDPPRFRVVVTTPDERVERMSSGLSVSNNPVAPGHAPYADRLDQGVLGLYIADVMSGRDMARLVLQVAVGRWQDNPQVSLQECSRITLEFPRPKRGAKAVIDGELIDLDPRIVFEVHPRALKVIVPSADEGTGRSN